MLSRFHRSSRVEVAPTRRGKMDSTPGQSGDSHPRHLVEERREEYVLPKVLPCPALPQSLSAGQVKILRELKKCANLFFFGGSSSRYPRHI